MTALLLALALSSPCLLARPVEGAVVAGFAPSGAYGGHWGADLAAEAGTPVHAAAPGTVTFAGDVAGMLTVTVHHGGGVRTSYSYLSAIGVASGARVDRGEVVGISGIDHGREAVHFSLRVGDRYLDPLVPCRALLPATGLRLVGVAPMPALYPVLRASRHSRRDVRPASLRSSHCGRGRISPARSRRDLVHPGGITVAEGR